MLQKFFTSAMALAVVSIVSAQTANAAPIVPSFVGAPAGWTVDRYQPNKFEDVGTVNGRDNVIEIGISDVQGATTRGGQSGSFYNTQGMKHGVSGGAGSVIAADLWVDPMWNPNSTSQQGPTVRTDLWGLLGAEPGDAAYPIIGYTNLGNLGGRFQAWDADFGWVTLGGAVNYGAWNSLSITYTGTAFEFRVNGNLEFTDNTVNANPMQFSDVFLQAYNYHGANVVDANAQNYSAYWANAQQDVPEPMSMTLLGLGLIGAGIARRRQRVS